MIRAEWNDERHGVELDTTPCENTDDLANFTLEVQSCISVLIVELARHGMEAERLAEYMLKVTDAAIDKAAEISMEMAHEIEKKNIC